MIETLWLATQFIVLFTLVIGLPTLLILGVWYVYDAFRWGRFQRCLSGKQRRRLNGTLIANHFGRIRN
jgi:hypothetical protein